MNTSSDTSSSTSSPTRSNTPPGAPVDLDLHRDGQDLVIAVRDRGIGIPEADREWLFAAFHRGRNVGERPGSGLGLTIVKRCVELGGGRISLRSEVGCGTKVTVRLPLFRPPTPTPTPTPSPTPNPTVAP